MSVQPPAPERASAADVPAQSLPVDDPGPAQHPVPPARTAATRPPAGDDGPKAKKGSAVDRLTRLPRVALLAGAGVMAALLVALVAFVIVPAFGSHQAKSQWTDTTVSLPAKVGDLKRLKSKQITALVKTMSANGIPRDSIGVYGTLGKNAVILVALKPAGPLSADDQEAERQALEKNFVSASRINGFRLAEQSDAGPLGGYLGCGKAASSTVTVCLATDSGSVVGTISGPAVKDAAALIRTARAAAVTRS